MKDVEKLQYKEAPKRYGMTAKAMATGFDTCEGSKMSSDIGLAEVAEDEPQFGGFLTRNNTWERI